MAAKASSTTDETTPTFEHAMERLENIVQEMEADQLPLEKLIARFEEGVKLVGLCSERLTAAEQRIRIIARNAEGKLKLEPFEENEDSANG
ncbi:MAG: exodeoxyribonuclease VII small subunit [Chthoniobacterales bacterium]